MTRRSPDDGAAPDDAGPAAADGVRRPRRREGFTLDRFLKYEGVAETGGMAKRLIQDGLVTVNGEVETRRRRQLAAGDLVRVEDEELVVPGEPEGTAGA